MASAAFTKALAKRKQSRKLMKKAREAERPNFELPKIEDGTYVARVKGKVGVTPNKGIPLVDFRWVIMDGEYKGKGWNMTYFLEGKDAEQEERTWENLGNTLKVLSTREDVDAWEIEDLEDIVKEITEELPLCRINIKYWKGATSEGYNCYFNELLSADALDTTVASADVDPEVDDYVIYDDGSGDEEYVVVKINQRKKTATIKMEDSDDTIEAKLDELELSNS